jgi:hypothetical protein
MTRPEPAGPNVRLRETTDPAPLTMFIRMVFVLVAVGVVFIAAILAPQTPVSTPVSSGAPAPSATAYPVNVSVIELNSSANVCGLNGTTEPGFLGMSNVTSSDTWYITAPGGGCTVAVLMSDTSGFVVVSADLPVTIPAAQTDGIQVSFLMSLLSAPYDGPLEVFVG